jgi:hypothetical protein
MPCRLGPGPTTGCPQLENRQALGGRVVRPTLGRYPHHPCVLDAHLLLEKSQLLMESFVLGLESDASVPAVGGPAACVGQGEVGQREIACRTPDRTRLGHCFGRGILGCERLPGIDSSQEGTRI